MVKGFHDENLIHDLRIKPSIFHKATLLDFLYGKQFTFLLCSQLIYGGESPLANLAHHVILLAAIPFGAVMAHGRQGFGKTGFRRNFAQRVQGYLLQFDET